MDFEWEDVVCSSSSSRGVWRDGIRSDTQVGGHRGRTKLTMYRFLVKRRIWARKRCMRDILNIPSTSRALQSVALVSRYSVDIRS
jgi:hypothetical protein